MADSTADGGDGSTFAGRLKRLFDVVSRPEGGAPYSVAEVAAAVGVSRQHLYDLIAGRRDRPSWELVTALAKFFGVSVVYFGDDEEAAAYARQIDLLAAVQRNGVEEIALRSGKLSSQHRGILAGLLDQLQSLEDDSGRQ